MDKADVTCVSKMPDDVLLNYMVELAEGCLDKWREGAAEKIDPESSRLLYAFSCVACSRVEAGRASQEFATFVEEVRYRVEEARTRHDVDHMPVFDVAVAGAIRSVTKAASEQVIQTGHIFTLMPTR